MNWVFILLLIPSFALSAPSNSEPLKQTIEKAHNLSIQRDRFQATRLLVSLVKSDEKKYSKNQELLRELEQISTVFYTDKGQQTFELAFSLKSNDTSASLAKLQESLRLEPDNVTILRALSRHYLGQKECSQAQAHALRAQEVNPYAKETKLILAQVYACSDKKEDYFILRATQDEKYLNSNIYWLVLEAEVLLKNKQTEKARDVATQAAKLDPKFPEAAYWLWQSSLETPTLANKEAQKYMTLCKALSERSGRHYREEPFLCKRMTESEAFLSKPGPAE